MKVGNLVRCTFQPKCGGYDKYRKRLLAMEHTIKGEFGIIKDINTHGQNLVLFPKFGYTHWLANNTLEVISE